MRRCPTCDKEFGDAVSFCPTDGAKLTAEHGVVDGGDAFFGRMLGGRYRIDRKLGQGGMGTVHIAEHVHMEKPVAVKILRAELASDETAAARFKREAKGASRIDHENCVAVTDFGRESDGTLYLVMELIEGETLWQIVHDSGAIGARRVGCIGAQIARALVAAHGEGVVHRDLKPENVMVVQREDKKDHVKVLDFGLAKLLEGDDGKSVTALTRAGAVFGTPRYMSPEQAEGRPTDHRTDIYSLGIILYEMATGTVPFDDESMVALLSKHVNEAPEPPRQRCPEAGIDPALESIILRCLEKDPDARHDSARDLLEDLSRLRSVAGGAGSPSPSMPPRGELVVGLPRRRPRWGRVALLTAATSLLGAAVMVALSPSEEPALAPTRSVHSAPPHSVPPPAQPPAQPSAPEPEVEPATEGSQPNAEPKRKRRRRRKAVPRGPKSALASVASEVGGTPPAAKPDPPAKPAPPPQASPVSPSSPARRASSASRGGPAPIPAPPPQSRPPSKPAAKAEPKPKPKPKPMAKPSGDLLEDGLARLREGDLEAAYRTLYKVSRERPEDPRVHVALSDLFVKKKDLRMAVFAIAKASRLDPESGSVLNRWGRIQYALGRKRQAAQTFRTVLQIKPGDPTALRYLGKLGL